MDSVFRNNIVAMARRSFGDSQGDQPLQVHVVQYLVKRLRESGAIPDMSLETSHADVIAARRPPKDHISVPPQQITTQFRFWWANIWDCVRSNYLGSADYPDLAELQERAWNLGATEKMSSFTPAEFKELDEAIQPYRLDHFSIMTSQVTLLEHVLPRLISVERDWQLDKKWAGGRPRTTSDQHESVWWKYAKAAHEKLQRGVPLTVMDSMYVDIAVTMDGLLTTGHPLCAAYADLLDIYNRNHPAAPTTCLYG